MAAGFVQVQPDSTGKKLQTFRNTVGIDSVDAEAVVLVDATGAAISPALDATLTGGSAKAIARGGAKGTTTAADVTSTPSGANHNGADVCLYDAAGNLIDPRSIRALTAADVVTVAPDVTSSGNLTTASPAATGLVQLTLGGNKSAACVQITGTFVGTIIFEATADGTNWFQITAFGALSGLTFQQTVNAGGNFTFMVGGLQAVRVNMSAYTSGSAAVAWRATSGAIGNQFSYARIQDPTSGGPVAGVSAKGTQASGFLGVQEAKDSGRVNIMWTAEFSPTAATEALLTITESRDGAGTTTFSSKVVTNGKRLRITSVNLQVENTLGTSIQRAYLRMRFNTAGAVTTSSAFQGTWAAQALGTVKSISAPVLDDFPDGVEFLGDGTKQIGFTLQGPDWVSATSTLKVYVTIFAFEY